jgi:DNA-binding NtrC family response regulator
VPPAIARNTENNHAPTVLVVDDEQLIRWSLSERLEEDSYRVVQAANGHEALAHFREGVDLVLLDYRLPDTNGFDVLRQMQHENDEPPIIMLTAHSSVEHAVTAMNEGAYHYVAKPFDFDQIALTVARALETTSLRREVRALRAARPNTPTVDSIIGSSRAVRHVKRLVERIATSPGSTVLITGESGTGKNLVAEAIHGESDRSESAFMNITCSALPAALLESELFGHERGAFTDAKAQKKGLLEMADGGTVFLDEMGEMELSLQAKLLRFLEERAFRRVGGMVDIRTDVRVIAATNRDLRRAVSQGAFREDLYYRLAVLTIDIPPLRERDDDIELLAAFLVDDFGRKFAKKIQGIDPAAMNVLKRHPWPGNVRELRNAAERAVLLTDHESLQPDDFAFLTTTAVDNTTFKLPAGGVDIRELERSLVEQALTRTNGNQTRAARLLGMNRDQIRYRMDRYGLVRRREDGDQDQDHTHAS